jgi:hypothetical protein
MTREEEMCVIATALRWQFDVVQVRPCGDLAVDLAVKVIGVCISKPTPPRNSFLYLMLEETDDIDRISRSEVGVVVYAYPESAEGQPAMWIERWMAVGLIVDQQATAELRKRLCMLTEFAPLVRRLLVLR